VKLHPTLWIALFALLLQNTSQAQSAPAKAPETALDATVLLAVAPNRPPCDEPYVQENCYGSRATTHSFPLPVGSELWFPQQPSERMGWVFIGPVMTRPADLSHALWVRVEAGKDGQYVLTAGLDRQETRAEMNSGIWTQIQIPLEQRFWVKIDPTTATR
jgi:hypothetical protein